MGIPTALQIEDYDYTDGGEKNPYYHTSGDNIEHMNLDYWMEQMKATTAIAAHLAIPVNNIYFPIIGDN